MGQQNHMICVEALVSREWTTLRFLCFSEFFVELSQISPQKSLSPLFPWTFPQKNNCRVPGDSLAAPQPPQANLAPGEMGLGGLIRCLVRLMGPHLHPLCK